jgi:hypothetical protein
LDVYGEVIDAWRVSPAAVATSTATLSACWAASAARVLALNYGRGTPLTVLVAHIVYGSILGAFCRSRP